MLKNNFAFSLLLLTSINILSQVTLSENNLDRCKHENCYKQQIEKIISLVLPEGSKLSQSKSQNFLVSIKFTSVTYSLFMFLKMEDIFYMVRCLR